ncbi:hypothetical protein Hypma_003768 [Hypsizygus marmoreus]|uniref:Reverse transcriptase domain-containing protein n=1 Tax=Hypsizygus marmoreus TaxID=39966 RepID=A0A369K0K4_HYPMA|nr:hypothetical protein Hypma_003768 [Hypsizygus marmoreus]
MTEIHNGQQGTQENSPQGGEDQNPPEPFSSETTRLCTSATDRYRAGEFSKSAAIMLIHDILSQSGADPEGDPFVAAFSSYVSILDGYERFRGDAATRGSVQRNDEGARPPHENSGTRESHDTDPSGGLQGEHADSPAPSKRSRSPSSDDERRPPRRRLNTSILPWIVKEESTPSLLSPSLRQTQLLLENFSRDLKLAKSSLTNSPLCPQFPDSEWTNLLSGKAVDFDRVLASLYSVSFDEQRREKLGDFELIAGSAVPARTVRSHSEWVIACDSAWEATLFVFPHRAAELVEYGNLTRLSDSVSPSDATSPFQTTPPSPTSTCSGFKMQQPLETSMIGLDDLLPQLDDARHADDGMMESVPTTMERAHMPTSALGAAIPATPLATATVPRGVLLPNERRSVASLLLSRPSYARDLIWADDEPETLSLARASESMPPLPPVPLNERNNLIALNTIQNNPSLFVVSTSVNLPTFRALLRDHPNQLLVDSVCRGLETGFWPWANTASANLPTTFGDVYPIRKLEHLQFALTQRNLEINAHCFSSTFNHLLPGMLAVPVTISERNPNKFRLCVDHSAEPFSRNAMIPKAAVSVPLDNLHLLGHVLRELRVSLGPQVRIVLFKSDVSRAYRTLPMHPLWQIKQVVKIDDHFNVDWRNNYGSRGAGGIWGAFFALVMWIAVYVKYITDLFAYVDDSFSWEIEGNLLFYPPYNKLLPAKQTRLLLLWDELGIPHDEPKQVWGPSLTIIGMEVDANAMTITMPTNARDDLLKALHTFAIPGTRQSLREFQRLAGWINWALDVYPLLRPGLSLLYDKISGKSNSHAKIWISRALTRELLWIANHISSSNGIFLLESVNWPISSANEIIYTDASPYGMAFWCPSRSLGFSYEIPPGDRSKPIFYFEAYAVLSAFQWITSILPRPQRVLIYTDNLNTVNIFNTLRASPLYNPILITTIDLTIRFNIQLRVLHIPGDFNTVADALSRSRPFRAAQLHPGLQISSFTPPRLTLGATDI